MNTTGKEGYEPIVQGLRVGPNDGEEPVVSVVDRAHRVMHPNASWQRFLSVERAV